MGLCRCPKKEQRIKNIFLELVNPMQWIYWFSSRPAGILRLIHDIFLPIGEYPSLPSNVLLHDFASGLRRNSWKFFSFGMLNFLWAMMQGTLPVPWGKIHESYVSRIGYLSERVQYTWPIVRHAGTYMTLALGSIYFIEHDRIAWYLIACTVE